MLDMCEGLYRDLFDDEPVPALFPYQEEGAQWLATKRRALLADDMGLGKTAQAIRAADLIGAERILILCPAIARTNWVREFSKFSRRGRSFSTVLSATDTWPTSGGIACSYDLITKPS